MIEGVGNVEVIRLSPEPDRPVRATLRYLARAGLAACIGTAVLMLLVATLIAVQGKPVTETIALVAASEDSRSGLWAVALQGLSICLILPSAARSPQPRLDAFATADGIKTGEDEIVPWESISLVATTQWGPFNRVPGRRWRRIRDVSAELATGRTIAKGRAYHCEDTGILLFPHSAIDPASIGRVPSGWASRMRPVSLPSPLDDPSPVPQSVRYEERDPAQLRTARRIAAACLPAVAMVAACLIWAYSPPAVTPARALAFGAFVAGLLAFAVSTGRLSKWSEFMTLSEWGVDRLATEQTPWSQVGAVTIQPLSAPAALARGLLPDTRRVLQLKSGGPETRASLALARSYVSAATSYAPPFVTPGWAFVRRMLRIASAAVAFLTAPVLPVMAGAVPVASPIAFGLHWTELAVAAAWLVLGLSAIASIPKQDSHELI